MPEDGPTLIQRQNALVYILNNIADRGAQFVMYASALGAIALIPIAQAPLEFIAAGLGVNLLSGIIERVARGEYMPKDRLVREIEAAIQASNLNGLLTKDAFFRALGRILHNQEKVFFTTMNNENELRSLSEQVSELLLILRGDKQETQKTSSYSFAHFYLHEPDNKLAWLHDGVYSLWQRAELIELYNPDAAIDYCHQAQNTIESYFAYASYKSDELYALQDYARRRYNDLRMRYEIPTTAYVGSGIVDGVIYFTELAAQDPTTPVTFFNETGCNNEVMQVSRALSVAQSRLVEFWGAKSMEYIEEARQYLDRHMPREALTVLRHCNSLPGRQDTKVKVTFPKYLELQIEEAAQKVVMELEALECAEHKVRLARLEKNPTEATRLLDAAKRDYPYLPELQKLDEDLQSFSKARNIKTNT